MQSKPESVQKVLSANTKPKSKSDQLKEQIKIQQQKLTNLKNIVNPHLLLKISQIEKQIKRIEIITIDESGSSFNKNFTKNQVINTPIEPHFQKQLSNEQNLTILKNITTKSYINKTETQNTQQKTNKNGTPSNKPFSSISYIQELEQKTAPHVMETQIYSLLNRYLNSKSSLLTKIIQLNPEKRHNNSLLIPHQRVMLKEHLDSIRRMNDELEKKSRQLQDELNQQFILVKNKWEESQRELIKLSQ